MKDPSIFQTNMAILFRQTKQSNERKKNEEWMINKQKKGKKKQRKKRKERKIKKTILINVTGGGIM